MTAAGRVPWLRYRDTGLLAVPSAHNRLVFAQLVIEACLRQPFDVIAVEAPASFNADGTLDAMARIAPHTGIVIERLESEDDHNVPAPSQFQDPFPWCERIIEPMEA